MCYGDAGRKGFITTPYKTIVKVGVYVALPDRDEVTFWDGFAWTVS